MNYSWVRTIIEKISLFSEFIFLKCVISLTVEIQFVSQIHLELDEWIREANPSFTELLDYHF